MKQNGFDLTVEGMRALMEVSQDPLPLLHLHPLLDRRPECLADPSVCVLYSCVEVLRSEYRGKCKKKPCLLIEA